MNNKTLLVLSLLFISNLSLGSSNYIKTLKKMTFKELQQDYDIDFENNQIWFKGKMLSILDTCMQNNETIRTINKVKIEEYDGEDFYYVGRDYLYKSIYSQRVLVSGDDTEFVDYVINKTRIISVVENDDDFQGDVLFKRKFTIPNCKH